MATRVAAAGTTATATTKGAARAATRGAMFFFFDIAAQASESKDNVEKMETRTQYKTAYFVCRGSLEKYMSTEEVWQSGIKPPKPNDLEC